MIDRGDWPDNFDFRTDPVCQEQFKPFIQEELRKLKAYDAKRPADTTYIFHQHAPRVARDVRETCHALGLAEHVCENMYWALLIHDIGKRKLPLHLWDMEEKPTDDIKALRRSHTDIGAQMLDEAFPDLEHPFLDLAKDILLNHHEQMDGGGHRGLTGEQLSTPVRLAAIVESYDGYAIWRPHFGDRDISPHGVIKKMREEKGASHYDIELFEVFAATKLNEKRP